MQTLSRSWLWTVAGIIAIIVIVLISVFWFLPKKTGAPGSPVFAPQGQITQGFPQNLLIDSSARIGTSYAIAYASTSHQYTVAWTSSSSPRVIASGYLVYFTNNGWRIAAQSTSSVGAQSIYAVSASGTANLVVMQEGPASQVTLSYVPAPVMHLPQPTLPVGFPTFLVPGSSSTLVAATRTGSSSVAIFQTNQTIHFFASSLVASLKVRQWEISADQETLTSAFIQAYATTSQLSVNMIQLTPKLAQMQIRYVTQ